MSNFTIFCSFLHCICTYVFDCTCFIFFLYIICLHSARLFTKVAWATWVPYYTVYISIFSTGGHPWEHWRILPGYVRRDSWLPGCTPWTAPHSHPILSLFDILYCLFIYLSNIYRQLPFCLPDLSFCLSGYLSNVFICLCVCLSVYLYWYMHMLVKCGLQGLHSPWKLYASVFAEVRNQTSWNVVLVPTNTYNLSDLFGAVCFASCKWCNCKRCLLSDGSYNRLCWTELRDLNKRTMSVIAPVSFLSLLSLGPFISAAYSSWIALLPSFTYIHCFRASLHLWAFWAIVALSASLSLLQPTNQST